MCFLHTIDAFVLAAFDGYGMGTGPIFMDQLQCTGKESRLVDCPSASAHKGVVSCDHLQDAGVHCVGKEKVKFCKHTPLNLPHLHADNDECVSANGGCEQRCNNTIGSFFCDCFNGYNLDEDQFNCNGM